MEKTEEEINRQLDIIKMMRAEFIMNEDGENLLTVARDTCYNFERLFNGFVLDESEEKYLISEIIDLLQTFLETKRLFLIKEAEALK
jgi:hypothetical protein